MDTVDELIGQDTGQLDLAEICCHPESELSKTCEALGGKAMRLSIGTGYDLLTHEGTQSALNELVARSPRYSWFATPCTAFCSWQRINIAKATELERKKFKGRQNKSRRIYRNALYLAGQLMAMGGCIAWEWPRSCDAWRLPEMQSFIKKHGEDLYFAELDGCEVGTKDPASGELVKKGWTIMTNSWRLYKALSLRCSHHEKHPVIQGSITSSTAYYPGPMCRKVVNQILKREDWKDVVNMLELADRTVASEAYPAERQQNEQDERDLELIGKLTAKERESLERKLLKLHHNCGHPPNHVLVKMLGWRKASETVLAMARRVKCSACDEFKPRDPKPASAAHQNAEPWSIVGCDMAEWKHPTNDNAKGHLWICVDEATKFAVGSVWSESRQACNIDKKKMLELLQERWIGVFGRMHTLRTDPEGVWIGKELQDKLSEDGIRLEQHPGEAPWQAAITENTIGIIKDTMTKIALHRPDLTVQEVLAGAVLAHNELERVRGFSPAQWAMGRQPNWNLDLHDVGNDYPEPTMARKLQVMDEARQAWLQAKNTARLNRAARARKRHQDTYRPGDEVDFWRRGKGRGTRPHVKGMFHGGAVVLATSTEIDSETGDRSPRKVVWIIHAGNILKCAPEQLKYSSERARQLAAMGQPRQLPWTIEGIDEWLNRGQYEDIRVTAEELEAADDDAHDEDMPALPEAPGWRAAERDVRRRLRAKTPMNRPATPAAASSLADPAPRPQRRGRSRSPRAAEGRQNHAVFVSMEVNSNRHQRQFVNRPGAFVTSQLRKRKVEVNTKKLSAEELGMLDLAKQNEIQQYLQNEAVEAIKDQVDLTQEELMGMRWVVTVKHFPQKKVKARLVILGYQAADLEDELLNAATPTPTRRSKQCFLQTAAHHNFELYKADVSGAFLQGRSQDVDRYVVPVDELADALGIHRGSPARLRKAGYGLVIAPKEWVESVYAGLREMGLVQCKTEPCCWKLVTFEDGKPILKAIVLFHIDDFLLAGKLGEEAWERFKEVMRNRWKWSEWERDHLRMTGVDVAQLRDHSFVLDQKAYVDNIDPAEIKPERRKVSDAATTENEKSMLRGIWGSMQWPCTQTDAKRACSLSMLQSSLPAATVATIMKTNKVLKEMKDDLLEIKVHGHSGEQLAVVVWSDASWANRPDLSSTLGFFSGITTTKILEGGRHGVTPIHHKTSKAKRKARSSLSAEVQALADAEQELFFTRLQLAEFLGYPVCLDNVAETVKRVPGVLVVDAKSIYDNMYGAAGPLGMEEKRTAIEMLGIQEGIAKQDAVVRWCHGEANLSDGLTKETAKTQLDNFYREGCTWSLVYDKDMVSARKRRKKGQQPLDEKGAEDLKDLEQEWLQSWPPTIANDDGEDILDPEADERAFACEPGAELRATLERLYWQP